MTGRRSLFAGIAGTAALLSAGRLAIHDNPDAELLAMGQEAEPMIAEYERIMGIWFRLPLMHPDSERIADMGEPIFERLESLVDRAAELTATTTAGFRAKALLLQHGMRVLHRTDGMFVADGPETELAWSLVSDMLAGAA